MPVAKTLTVLWLVAVVAMMAATAPAEASPDQGSLQFSLHSEPTSLYFAATPRWILTLEVVDTRAIRTPIRDVKVQLSVDPPELAIPGGWSTERIRPPTNVDAEPDHDGHLDPVTGVWTIPVIPPGGGTYFLRIDGREILNRDGLGGEEQWLIARLHAEILPTRPMEQPPTPADNETEAHYVVTPASRGIDHTVADPAVYLRFVSKADDEAVIGITAANDGAAKTHPGLPRPGSKYINYAFEVSLVYELTEGLEFAPGPLPSGVRQIDGRTRRWNVGTIFGTDTTNFEDFPVQDVRVVISAFPSVGDLPLSERCLTAKLVQHYSPAFKLDLRKHSNDVATLCLEDTKRVLSSGEIILWWLHDCVGVTGHPCNDADELLLLAREDGGNNIKLPDYITSLKYQYSVDRYLAPDSIIINVRDPAGRKYDTNSNSVTDPTTVSWQTGRKESGNFDHRGIRVWYSRVGFNTNIADWSNLVRTVSVSGLHGTTAPGRVKVRFDSSSAGTFFNPNPSHERPAFNLSRPASSQTDMFLEFETLGTYVVNFHALSTRSDGVTTYPASGDYIFHVGPIAELAVMDGGEGSPLAGVGRTAYTIHAANNGPDEAPEVQVALSGVPEGAESIASEGIYEQGDCDASHLCDGTWTIGAMPISGPRPFEGKLAFPTLTLIAPAGVPTGDITATIANTEEYSVTIDGRVHSTPYFDYIGENNAATIMAQPGTGGPPPGTPQDLQGSFFPTPPTAVVQWNEVESLNGWPVSHYEMSRFEDESGRPCLTPELDQAGVFAVKGTVYQDRNYNPDASICYYVRAVNMPGVAGYWSEAVAATSEGLDEPRLSLEAGPDVGEGEDATFTVRASPAPVAGDTLVVYYTVADKRVDIETGGYVDATEEGRQDITLDNRGRATITVPTQSDDLDRPDGEVTVTLENGLGYTRGTPSTASVAVLDDDNPTVSFAASPTEPLSEGNYIHNVTVNLDRPSHAALDIHYTLGGDVGDEDVRFSIAGSGRERSVRVPSGVTSVDIPVRVLDDNDTSDDTVLNLFLSPRHYYDVGNPSSYTLTIIEDDGPRAEFALTESAVDEANTTHNVVVNLNPAPDTTDVTINYTIGGTARRDEHYSIVGATGSTGSVSAGARDTSVTIPVTIINNGAVEGDKTVVLTLLNSPGNYTRGDGRKHTVTIRDDDLPRARFAAGASNPGEGKGTHTVRVNLSPPAPPDGLTLRYGVGGTASRNRDYQVDNTTFALGGATGVDIWVEITDDGDNEPDETVVLTLRAGSGYAVGDPGEHTLTIADDDLPLVAFAAAEASASEAAGTHRATILVEPAAHEDFTVSYSVGGTATEGAEEDFTISGLSNGSGTVTVPARASRVQVPVTIRNDEINEGDQTVVLTLTGCDGCNLALPIRHELTIRDDDAPVVSFAEPAVSVYEDNIGTHTVRVNLDRPAEPAFTLKFDVKSLSPLIEAGAGDYSVPTPNEAQVIAGRDYVDIPVTITADMDNEADERLVLMLETGPGYSLGQITEYTLTIMDDDNDENTPVFTMNHPAIHGTGITQSERWEDGGTFNPTFYVTNSFTGRVYFQYVGGTATPSGDDKDFTLFNIGDQTIEEAGDIFWVTPGAPFGNDFGRPDVYWARFGFAPRKDDKAEGSETAIFRLLNGPGYRVSGYTDYTITIRNAN